MTLVWMVVAWIAGLALATARLSVVPVGGWLIGAGIILAILTRRDAVMRQVALCIFAAGLGIVRVNLAQPQFTGTDIASFNDKGSLQITGVVVDAPDVRDQDIRLRVDVQSIQKANEPPQEVHGSMLVSANRFGGYAYGDQLRISGEPVTPPIFDTFNYQDYLARSGVYTLVLNGSATILQHDLANPILAALLDVRERSHQLITRLLPSPQSGLLSGILLGIYSDLPPEVTMAFQQTGTSHIIAISGSNITIIAGLLFAVFGQLRDKRLAVLLMLIGITIYTVFVGATPSVVRAAIMAGLALVAQRLGRRSDGLTALAIAFWFMTLLNPGLLLDAGLLLSSAATLGLILFTEPLDRAAERIISRLFAAETAKRVVRVVSEAVLVTIAAQITTLPIIFLMFGQLSLISFPVNALVVPAQASIMALGILAVAVGAIWLPAGQIVAWLVGIPLSYTLAIIRSAAQLPGAAVPITVDPAAVAVYYAGLFGLAALVNMKADRRRGAMERVRHLILAPTGALLGFAVAALIWAMVLSRPDGKLHVWFLAVGADSATLIQTPGGAHLLIDGGGNPTELRTAIGDRLPFYKNMLDMVLITQPTTANIAALPPLMDRYTVRDVISDGLDGKDRAYSAFLAATRQDRTQMTTVTAGYHLQTDDGVAIDTLGSPDTASDSGLNFRVTYGDASFLITPDSTALDQLRQLAQEPAQRSAPYLRATVAQIPADGKIDVADWRQAVAPQVVVIEAGNRPPPDSLLGSLGGLPVYRTDQQGTVEMTTDGKQLWISTANTTPTP